MCTYTHLFNIRNSHTIVVVDISSCQRTSLNTGIDITGNLKTKIDGIKRWDQTPWSLPKGRGFFWGWLMEARWLIWEASYCVGHWGTEEIGGDWKSFISEIVFNWNGAALDDPSVEEVFMGINDAENTDFQHWCQWTVYKNQWGCMIAEMARERDLWRLRLRPSISDLSFSATHILHDGGRIHLFISLGQWRPVWRPSFWRSIQWPTFFPVSGLRRRNRIHKWSHRFNFFTTSLKFRFSKQVTHISALAGHSSIVVRPPWTIIYNTEQDTKSRRAIIWWTCTAGIMRARCDFSLLTFYITFSDFFCQCGVPLLLDRIKQSTVSCRVCSHQMNSSLPFPTFNFQEASVFFKKRAIIEDEYGKQLQKLARTTSEVYGLNDGKAGYAAFHALMVLRLTLS